MITKKKIFIIIPSFQRGGAETVLINFLNLLDYSKFDVTVYAALNKGILLKNIPKEVTYSYLTNSSYFYRVANYLYARFGWNFLLKTLAIKIQGKYDVGMSFIDGVNTDLLLFSKSKFGKLITVVQSNYQMYQQKRKYLNSSIGQLRAKRRYTAMDYIICVSNSTKEGFEQTFGTNYNTLMIYNPINESKLFMDSNLNLYFDKNVLNLLALGRLIPVKGYENLIHAVAKLTVNGKKNLKLRIIGDGPLKQDLIKLVESLNCTEYVQICGYVEDAYAYMKESDLFVMTSFSEGLPTALCEAMILGKPVLATNVSGCSEVIDNGNFGFMVEPNIEDIYSCLNDIMNNRNLLEDKKQLSLKRAETFKDQTAMSKYYELFK